jgi:hypothetical protein
VESPLVQDRAETVTNSNYMIESELVTSAAQFASLENDILGWDAPNMSFPDLVNLYEKNDSLPYSSSTPSPLVHYSTTPVGSAGQSQESNISPAISIPVAPSHTIRLLNQRPKSKIESQRVADLILHTLKSYPIMLRQNTLPPFVHPKLLSADFDQSYMEPLNNCISLLYMVSSGVQGSRKLFWKNVRLECERLCTEACIAYLNVRLITERLTGIFSI